MNKKRLPSVAMLYDGVLLENVFDGYRTLRVAGRESLSLSFHTEKTEYGSIITKQEVDSRTLTINFHLKAEDNKSFQDTFKKMISILKKKEDVEIKFADDPDTSFFGRFESLSEVPDDTNEVLAAFTIFCQDPYKYGPVVESSGKVKIPTLNQTLPQKIELTKVDGIAEITHNDLQIAFTDTVANGDIIDVNFDRKSINATKNGQPFTYALAINSDLENFFLSSGDTVQSAGNTIRLFMRERWL